MGELLLGIDLGTTGTKAILLAPGGGIVAEATVASALHSDRPGFAEADTGQWWENVRAAIRELLQRSGAAPGDVAGVATSGMVPAVVPLDAGGTPLRRAILQNDARAVAEIDELASALHSVDLVALTGSALTQQSVAPTLRWLERHEPEVASATRSLAGSYDWLLRRLGAEPHVERNWAIESGLYDLGGAPLPAVLEAAGIDPALLPPVVDGGTVVGEVSAAAAAETGLAAGTPLVAGGADHVLSAYAAGLSAPGDTLVKLGGAGDVLIVADGVFTDARLYLDAHPMPGLWLPNGCMATSGSLIRWFQALVGGADLLTLDDEARERPPAEVLCLPYFLGEKSPLHDPALRGAFAGLHLGHDRADMYRSVLEAVAYGFRHHFDVLAERGVAVGPIRVTNGGSKSVLWKQIHADVLRRTLTPIVDHPGASLGAALAAGVGTGRVDGWGAVADHVRLGEPVEPDPARAAAYDEAYALWRRLGDTMTPISHSLAARSAA
ncbi:MAG TPA: FGGY family carbohydrate kinase [Baekduia sp.]|nr:FGGY family carbohydrate kinase [Baekduia sp.]